MVIDYKAVRAAAEGYKADMTKLLRDLIKLAGESCDEERKVYRIKEEMEKLGYTRTYIDGQGNIHGYMGNPDAQIIAFDGHIDTVGIGNIANWKFDPYDGYENETEIGGRGASDQLGGVVSAIYGAKIMKDLNLLTDKYQVLVTGTVQEEDCDGNCWLYIVEQEKIKPTFVVSTEPTNNKIYRGHRGRMEIRVDVEGVSCHGSAPERGNNAIYMMADILQNVRDLHRNDAEDGTEIKGLVKMLDPKYNPLYKEAQFLGRGSITCSEIFYTSPSRCAVADGCSVSLDRRMTAGETHESCLAEIEALPFVKQYGAKVSMYTYSRPSWKGTEYPQDCFFPTWVIGSDAAPTKAMVEGFTELYGEPIVDKWTFSTNGVAIMGRHGIPCIGLGPGKEEQAHAPNEINWKDDLVQCAAIYSVLPYLFTEKYQGNYPEK